MTRNCRFELRFTKNELSELQRKARKAGLSNAGFIRKAVGGAEIKEAPPVDVPHLLNEIRRVGYNLNELLKIANGQGLLDVPQIRKTLCECREVLKTVNDAYVTRSD
ncbi:MAG: hypothetical protein II881_03740 [Oscillospiraceae bacterium]|nr:hypothetical protein [Oscillospiraceae bacterium]